MCFYIFVVLLQATSFSKTPIKWHMEMSSKYNCSEVTTIFFHAESAIFPTVIFNNYGRIGVLISGTI